MKPPELSNSDFEMQVRKSYIKPGIERVRLVPEETVLGGCKIVEIGSGFLSVGCWNGALPCDANVDVS